jgi:hypothetical protein
MRWRHIGTSWTQDKATASTGSSDMPEAPFIMCTRGHVPLWQNQAVGGALGNFIVANRILDYDPYRVQVTAS